MFLQKAKKTYQIFGLKFFYITPLNLLKVSLIEIEN